MLKMSEEIIRNQGEDLSAPMENEMDLKRKRVIVAITVAAVAFLFGLIVFLCYDLIAANGKVKRVDALEKDIAALEQTLEEGKDTLAARKQRWYIERRARELGYSYANDKTTD